MRLFKRQRIDELFSEKALKIITSLKAKDLSSSSQNKSLSIKSSTTKQVSQIIKLLKNQKQKVFTYQSIPFHYGTKQSDYHNNNCTTRIKLPPQFSPYMKFREQQKLIKSPSTNILKPFKFEQIKQQSRNAKAINTFLNPPTISGIKNLIQNKLQKKQISNKFIASFKQCSSQRQLKPSTITMVDFDKIKMEQSQDHSKYVEQCIPKKRERSPFGDYEDSVNFINDIVDSRLEAVKIIYGEQEKNAQKFIISQRRYI